MKFRYIILWAFEILNIVSNLVVCHTYVMTTKDKEIKEWNDVITCYYILFIVNLYFWVLPLPPILLHQDQNITERNDKAKTNTSIHVAFVDALINIPMVCLHVHCV